MGFKTAMEAVLQFFKIFGPLLTTFVKGANALISYIVDYFTLKTQRLKDMAAHDKAVKQKAMEEQHQKEMANVAAFKSIEEEAWLIRYNDIVAKIQAEDYDGVLKITDRYDSTDVDAILFDNDSSPEYRAMKIVKLMKGESI